MAKKRKRRRVKKPPVPLFHISDEPAMIGLVHWVRRLPFFDTTDEIVSRGGKPSVAIKAAGKVIAGVVCPTEALRHGAAMICEFVIIRREDQEEAS